MKPTTIFLALLLFFAGFLAGNVRKHQAIQAARDAEYIRVVAAIARTMRCSTEEEFDAGLDHECDPSEVEQDAGLVDEKGEIKR